MDIRKLAVEETSVLHLRDADDELLYEQLPVEGKPGEFTQGEPVTITLYGPGTKTFAKAQAAKQNRMMDRLKKKGKSDQSAEEIIEENAKFFVACTKSMSHVEMGELQGEALFKAVYSDTSVGFIATQVNAHLGEWANFTKGSAKS